jgi:hypothetical protein
MKKSYITVGSLLVLALALLGPLSGCRAQYTPPVSYSVPELKYRLLSNFDDVFWCDPDLYPVARPGQEEANALEQFPIIKANEAEFSAILAHLGLPNKADYTDAEKLAIYREHKKLTYAVAVTASGDIFNFSLRVGENQGYLISGTITPSGEITVVKRETSFNTCPICLAKGTLIETPNGPVPVEQLRKGMIVWTVDNSGNRVAAVVARTASTPVPTSFRMLRLTLEDGRTVIASPAHPTAEGRALGDYHVGDTLDGARVVAVELVVYDGGVTYDLLPSGTTGLYRANGILLKSTLTADLCSALGRAVHSPEMAPPDSKNLCVHGTIDAVDSKTKGIFTINYVYLRM